MGFIELCFSWKQSLMELTSGFVGDRKGARRETPISKLQLKVGFRKGLSSKDWHCAGRSFPLRQITFKRQNDIKLVGLHRFTL